MTKGKLPEQLYEEDIKPLIEDKDLDPFRSRDISSQLPYSSARIGQALTVLAKSDSYEVERVMIDPSIYTIEGNDEEIYDRPLCYDDRKKKTREKIQEELKEKKEITDEELIDSILENVETHYDYENIPAKHEKVGEIREEIKELEFTEYLPEQSIYKINT